jgi:hypothetical protein
MVNFGDADALSCRVGTLNNLPLTVGYLPVLGDNVTPTGPADTPFDLPQGATQFLILFFTPNAAFEGQEVYLDFTCDGNSPAVHAPLNGINSVNLTAFDTPHPDIITISATPSGDGILNVPAFGSYGAMGVAAVNIGEGLSSGATSGAQAAGDSADLVAWPDLGEFPSGLQTLICETDPGTGACLAPPAICVNTRIGITAKTYTVFAGSIRGAGAPLFIDISRLNVRFFARPAQPNQCVSAGQVYGATGASVQSPGPSGEAIYHTGIHEGLSFPAIGHPGRIRALTTPEGKIYARILPSNGGSFTLSGTMEVAAATKEKTNFQK